MKKGIKRLLQSFMLLTFCMVFTNVQILSVHAVTVPDDGINDAWEQDAATVTANSNAVNEKKDGWLHLKASTDNRNGTSGAATSLPAIFVNPTEFDFTQAGFFEAAYKSSIAPSNARFGIFLGYASANPLTGMFIGYDADGWFWQKYKAGNGDWYKGNRTSGPDADKEIKLRLDWTADQKVTFSIDGNKIFTEEEFGSIEGLGTKIALKCSGWDGTEATATNVYLKDIHYTGQREVEATAYTVSGKMTDADGNPVKDAKVKLNNSQTLTAADGTYSFTQILNGNYTLTVSKEGFYTFTKEISVNGQDVTVEDIQMEAIPEADTDTLTTEDMDVVIDQAFPRVIQYQMKKGDLAGKTFYGQELPLDSVEINGIAVKVTNVQYKKEGSKAVYTMDAVDGDNSINASIEAELSASGNTLAFHITKIENKLEETAATAIQTISIPNHSLVSVRSSQTDANFKGAAMSSNTHISGDEYVAVDENVSGSRDYMYGFVSNAEMSAGLWSNSEHDGRAAYSNITAGSKNTRVFYNVEEISGEKSLGLSSAPWYYHRVITDTKNKSYIMPETEMPQTKVVIAGDENQDSQIDWQDGAIAYRSIMNKLTKAEEVPELVAYRIAMNFGSQAQNPFLTTLDNVKKVALHTDGLGQAVLLKGYGSEGHDSGYPDYADIGKRIGGVKDMNTLMERGAEYGARFGIHVNASEMYPEAKAFTDDSVRRDANGNLRYGWNWLDQGVGIDGIWDLGTGSREKRFDALKALVGDNLDFVYLDVWGNNSSSSDEDSYLTRKISKEITSNGWRMANKWGAGNEYDATFQHWAADLTYGGYDAKGENSAVMRFIRNHEKDSWIGDYPSYGGAANAPLLGGYNMKDFEGWQGRSDYDAYIKNLYTHNLTTKFIQHFEVVKWEDGSPVTMSDNGRTYQWTPEMKITLKDDAGNTLVLERKSDDVNDPDYRDRTITLNGKVIATGAVSRGDGTGRGDETYLLPWNWDAKTGDMVSSGNEKLYHWNTAGGTTTWELPANWSSLSSVKMYKLTDLGKTDETEIAVVSGNVTLTADAQTPYVICKGAESNLEIAWSEGMHIADAGFNSGNLDIWKVSGAGEAAIVKSESSNGMLKLTGEKAVSQTLTDLEAGKNYAVYVGVDNRSDAKAWIELKTGGKTVDSNYTGKSIAKNYVKADPHSINNPTVDGSSYFQNMYVYFTAPSDEVTLTLKREAGAGDSYFDNIRVVENGAQNITKDKNGNVIKFTQDFEDNAQGIYPFVVSGSEGVEDNRIHLSELHDKYTQAGWDVKKLDDVLDGNWSLKANGLSSHHSWDKDSQVWYNFVRDDLIYQTVPQNFRFAPGVTYKVSFDYQTGWDDIYAVAIGNGEYGINQLLSRTNLAMGARGENQKTEFTITGAADGQTWFGIYATDVLADLQNVDGREMKGAEADFGGYKDFILDNLVIVKVEQTYTKDDLTNLIREVKENYQETDYSVADWNYVENALVKAQVALEKEVQSEEDYTLAYQALKAAMIYLDGAAGPAASNEADLPLADEEGNALVTVSAGSFQTNTDGEGDPNYAIDGNTNSIWHTAWGDNSIGAGTSWIDFELAAPSKVDGLRYLPRSGEASINGKILKYEVFVKTEGLQGYTKAAEGEWDTQTSWKLVKFDKPLEQVTNVRLLALSSTGVDDSQKNMFASAAEIRLTNGELAVGGSTKADKTALKAAIDAAADLSKDNYTEGTWSNLQEKLEAAKKAYEKEDATAYEVELARANLMDAVKGLKPVEKPGKPETRELEGLIAEYTALDKNDYTEAAWNAFEAVLNNAKAALGKTDLTQGEVDRWIAELKAAKADLDQNKKPDPKPDPKPGPDPKPDPNPKPDPDPKPDPNPNPNPDPNPKPDPKPNPDPNPNPGDGSQDQTPDGPTIEGGTVSGWKAIIETLENSAKGSTTVINMGEETKLPASVLESVQGQNKKIVFKLKNGVTWTIDGLTIKQGELKDIDLNVVLNSNAIPQNLVNTVAKGKNAIQISLSHDGELGFTATLKIPVGKAYAGQYANLYYYNEGTGKLEMSDSAKVDKDGNAGFKFTHASDYLIVFDSKEHKMPKTGDTMPFAGTVLLMLAAAAAGTAAVIYRKRKCK